jgi:hypothetical protein
VTGVQGEQAATLLMCLRELDRSNLFIGFYGERYGWALSEDAFRGTLLKVTPYPQLFCICLQFTSLLPPATAIAYGFGSRTRRIRS